jgi:hypothetical protein
MITTVIEKKDLISEFGGAPKVITSDAQHERYVSTLLELERRESGGQLNAAERAFAELLTLLVDKYEEEHHAIPSARGALTTHPSCRTVNPAAAAASHCRWSALMKGISVCNRPANSCADAMWIASSVRTA